MEERDRAEQKICKRCSRKKIFKDWLASEAYWTEHNGEMVGKDIANWKQICFSENRKQILIVTFKII